jgi:hypothetical protein
VPRGGMIALSQSWVLEGSLVFPEIHNSMIFRAKKEYPYKSSS